LLDVGDTLRAGAIELEVEHAASFDIDTAETAGPLSTGRAAEVDIREQTAALQPHRHYVSVHTHRTSAAFSDLDVDVLLRNSPLSTIVVVGHDGTWYVLSKRRGARVARPETGVAAFRTAFATLSVDYLARVQAGQLTSEEAFRDALHRIWQVIAPPLGLRY